MLDVPHIIITILKGNVLTLLMFSIRLNTYLSSCIGMS